MATLEYSRVVAAGPGWTQVQLPDGSIYTMRGDRAMRNNNPGNIEYGRFTRGQGAIGTDGRFAVFPSRQSGMDAQGALIFESPNYRNLTLRQAITKYAPPFENNTARYVARVAAAAGVDPDTKMKDIPLAQRQAVLEGMHAVEGNTKARGYDAATGKHNYTTDATSPAMPTFAPIPPSRNDPIPPALLSTPAYREAAQGLLNAGVLNIGGKTVPYNPPALNPAPVGRVEYGGPLKPATAAPSRPVPSALNPAPVGRVERGGALKPATAASSRPVPPALQPAPVGAVQRAPLPPANPKPVQPDAAKQAQAYQAYAQSRAAAPATPVAPPPAPALSPKEIAAYQQYAQSRMAAPLEPVPALEVPVVKPLPPPVPVLAPKLPVPRVVRDFPVAAPQDVFPAAPPPPVYTPADVYAGLAPSAMSASGNMVSRDALGRTAVTNQFGATTITNAQGNQSAGSINPGIGGPLGQSQGIQPQTAVKMKTMAGGALGGLVAGPVGAIVGGLLARDIATGQPLGSTVRGLLGGNNSFQVRSTPGGPVQTQKFAAPNPKLNQFPGTPMPPPGGITTPSGSNLSYSQMSSISPAAASAISRGQGGLY